VSPEGIIQGRYTNGQSRTLGQVVLRVVHSKDAIEEVIEGQNQDRTWLQVCEFLKAKETGDSSDNAAAKARAIAEPHVPQLAPDEIENPIDPNPAGPVRLLHRAEGRVLSERLGHRDDGSS